MSKKYTNEDVTVYIKEHFDNNFVLCSDYVDIKSKLKIKCCRCDTMYDKTFDYIKRKGLRCVNCDDRKTTGDTVVGVNDLWTTRPDVAALLKDPADGYKYMENSGKFADFVCPECGSVHNSRIYNISRYGLACRGCSDGISFANKFMFQILKQVKVSFDTEWSPEWIQPYRYDFHFVVRNQEYVVEMDGGWHYFQPTVGDKTIEEIQQIDLYKDMMASTHNIQVIRIDCNYKSCDRYQYIKDNIVDSAFVDLFDITSIDFRQCGENAEKSILKTVCDLWNSGLHIYEDIVSQCGISKITVKRLLIRSEVLGLTNYKHQEYCKVSKRVGGLISAARRQKPVRCIETNEVFNNLQSGNQKYRCNICNYIQGVDAYAGTLADGTRLHWELLNEEDRQKYILNDIKNIQTIQNDYFN